MKEQQSATLLVCVVPSAQIVAEALRRHNTNFSMKRLTRPILKVY